MLDTSMFSLLQKLLLLLLRIYRVGFTPLRMMLGAYGCCRFTPTCSSYAEEAICQHGALPGLYLTTGRLLRCHPWGGYGYDPVPPRKTPHPSGLNSLPPVS